MLEPGFEHWFFWCHTLHFTTSSYKMKFGLNDSALIIPNKYKVCLSIPSTQDQPFHA